MWIRARRADIRSPERILSPPDREGYVYCPLCEQRVPGWNRDEHHRAHMADLDAWQANTPPEPTPSERRAERRRAQRWRERARAEEFEKDPYLYAVTEVVTETDHRTATGERSRPVTRRRWRHPRGETEARVRALLKQGRMPSAIASELRISLDYTRRIIRSLESSK